MQIPEHIAAVFALFGSAYPSWKVSEDTIRAWAALTSDADPYELLRSAIEHTRSAKWPPTVAEIRTLADPGRAYRIRQNISRRAGDDHRKEFLAADRVARQVMPHLQLQERQS